MNVLIVEDEPKVAKSIKKTLLKSSMINIVDIAHNFNDAFEKFTSDIFDIVLLDVCLGKNSLTGLDLCKKIREKNIKIPIIIITGLHSVKYLEKAFKLGANDYIRKPFNSRELELRVKRWCQISDRVTIRKNLIYDELLYDFQCNKFYFRDRPLTLTKSNKILLRLFIEHPEKLLSNKFIREKFWGDISCFNKSRNLRSNIQSLRQSLNPECSNWIQTVRGEGYILKK